MGLSFKPELLELIRKGKKTRTRRPVKVNETFSLDHEVVFAAGRAKWQVGHTYALVPGRGKPAWWRMPDSSLIDPLVMSAEQNIALNSVQNLLALQGGIMEQIKVLSIGKSLLSSLEPLDISAEGFHSRDAFKDYWDTLYEHQPEYRWSADPLVWVLYFDYVWPIPF